jgi:hypothetical protein
MLILAVQEQHHWRLSGRGVHRLLDNQRFRISDVISPNEQAFDRHHSQGRCSARTYRQYG